MKAERPEAIPLAGGTDVMVDMNFGRLRPPAIIDVSRLGELTSHREDNGKIYLGSGVTYATIVRPKKTAIAPDELIVGTSWRRVRGPGSFSKIGTRNAMVIAVAGLCLVVDEDQRRVRVALGSVGPVIIRASEAEENVSAALATAGSWDDPAKLLADQSIEEFAELVAAAARPLDELRGTANYPPHGSN